MNRYFVVLLTAASALLLQPVNAANPAEKQEAITKLEQAASKTNILDLPSFLIKATIRIIDHQGNPLEGSYQVLWNGPDQWREEITLPGYAEVQVGGKGIIWMHRSTNVLPVRINQLHAALGLGSGLTVSTVAIPFVRLDFGPHAVKNIHSRKQKSNQLTCVEFENTRKYSSELCIDDNANTIVRDSLYYEDKDFRPIGGKVFPRSLSFVEEGQTVATISIQEMTTPGQFLPDSFAPIAGVVPQEGCMNPEPPRIIESVAPKYPEIAKRSHVQGSVAVDAWISAEGVPRIGEFLIRLSPELDKSTADTMKQWRYEPAKCDAKPVAVETVLQAQYTLR